MMLKCFLTCVCLYVCVCVCACIITRSTFFKQLGDEKQFVRRETIDSVSFAITVAVSVQFSSVAQSCLTLYDSMDCSTPGLPVHHQLLELLKLMSIELVMPSNHLILFHLLLFLPSVFPRIRVAV